MQTELREQENAYDIVRPLTDSRERELIFASSSLTHTTNELHRLRIDNPVLPGLSHTKTTYDQHTRPLSLIH